MLLCRQSLPGLRLYSTVKPTQLISFASSDAFKKSLNDNKALKRLGSAYMQSKLTIVDGYSDNVEISAELNSLRTLPRSVLPKDEIFHKVSNDPSVPNWRKPITKWFKLGVYIIKYYKKGVQAIYTVHKETSKLRHKVDKTSNVPLATDLYKYIELSEIESQKNKESSIASCPISRKQFVEYHRRQEFWKLPSFILLALIFEEFTAVICYFFPKMVPFNCLIPGGYQKLSKQNARDMTISNSNEFKYQSPYTISKTVLYEFLKGRVAESYISKSKIALSKLSNNRKIPSEALTYIYQHMFVDDWLLLNHIFQNTETKISFEELVNAIMERKLYTPEEDLNQMVNTEIGRKVLTWRLLIYWSYRFEGCVSVIPGKMEEGQLFSQKWGINNVSIINHPGTINNSLVTEKDIPNIECHLPKTTEI
ncbi:hypothetical protein Kpol_1064p29 [Vanderwaltozyma polyspora DSM 70294]|uniref:Letm1 RBD domain-containing protein n=1 Tax=Vanderwaltozyma polyspora (strain ATCC 22028 / DSM 70294 / BCRC 21397 / CBS 2163 / NBRC 10782 / NRRL Y-8283 / UCD 57-17) TaxID=436907 RepID=A7TMF4_VANPO|nr:uncharacterized protein Kpol_1064p29 [Vanderwaltozyma polyspora DSM 70294]EDO16548.1 hypothetical protein Kpol_1064p29 [Vanderwaltozyma polyspora DSM 70294]